MLIRIHICTSGRNIKNPSAGHWQRGGKKGVIFIYINKCNVQFGALISAISVWVVPDIVIMLYPITRSLQSSTGASQ